MPYGTLAKYIDFVRRNTQALKEVGGDEGIAFVLQDVVAPLQIEPVRFTGHRIAKNTIKIIAGGFIFIKKVLTAN